MTAITRTPLCSVRGCPAPKDPEWHIPICGHGLEGQQHHVTKRSQGGKWVRYLYAVARNLSGGEG